ncbi:hypothetical protein ACFRQM_17935 [Streptomyces sp. NPDC056831]|uniref:hypothetical protein n=1 Tax=Streptomyces sp. NPDC056831 TaxID=3345954 RepID=UPI0036A75330
MEYDTRAKAAADRLIESMSTVNSQPAVVDPGRAGVVSVLGSSDAARGVVRALLCQPAVRHAPDDVGVAIVTGGEDREWAKWLPHTHEPDATGEAKVVPLAAEDFEGIAGYLRTRLEQAAERPDVRHTEAGAPRAAPASAMLGPAVLRLVEPMPVLVVHRGSEKPSVPDRIRVEVRRAAAPVGGTPFSRTRAPALSPCRPPKAITTTRSWWRQKNSEMWARTTPLSAPDLPGPGPKELGTLVPKQVLTNSPRSARPEVPRRARRTVHRQP